MPEKPPSIPPPPADEQEIVFVGPEEEGEDVTPELGWRPDTIAKAEDLRRQIESSLSQDPDETGPIIAWPSIFKQLGLVHTSEEGVDLMRCMIEAEKNLKRGRAPSLMSPESLIRVYEQALILLKKYGR
jgi:hypothetical protein